MFKFFFILLSFFLMFGTPTFANDVLTAQKLLTKLGYNPGPIDGSYGGKTKKALEKFAPSKAAPANQVAKAAHLNHNNARGATCLVIPPAVPSAAASFNAGT